MANRRFLRAAALLLLVLSPLRAESLGEWFASDSFSPYTSLKPELERLRGGLISSGIPEELLVERLREGSGKKIAPAKLLAAVAADCGILKTLRDLEGNLWPPQLPQDSRLQFFRDGSKVLRGGISAGVLRSLLEGSSTETMQRRLEAALAVAAVNARFPLKDSSALDLAQSLDVSSEDARRFSRLSSIFVRGRSKGMVTEVIAETVVRNLVSGRTLFAAETEIDGR